MKMLFPKYLPQGSKGPAVTVLQLLLLALGLNSKITPDGIYGEETAAGVKIFQARSEIEEDGHFGPDTRKAFLQATGIDVNAIKDLGRKKTILPR